MKPAPRIPGVAPALAARLAKLGIARNEDLVLHLPLRYEDETQITPVGAATPGISVQCEVEVIGNEIAYRPRRQLLCRTRDESGSLLLRFLNFYPSQQKLMQAGARLRVFGEIRHGFFGNEMVHPRVHRVSENESLPDRMTPVYPATAGLGQATLGKLVARAMQTTPIDDTLPNGLRERYALPEFAETLRHLHFPPAVTSALALEDLLRPYWRRIRFDELLAQQLCLRRAYRARRQRQALHLPPQRRLTSALLDSLSFRLTAAQQRVHAEIAADMTEEYPMQRLLQGDVGSGKTIVAALAMLQAVENGYQAALMAPTEILAEQHYRKLLQWLPPLGIKIAWLTGSLKKKDKAAMIEAIKSGAAQIAVGTHALIEDSVDFSRLGLIVVDEQHRFGVRQRLALREKGRSSNREVEPAIPSPRERSEENVSVHAALPQAAEEKSIAPHQLMMSATPIPRTLAMSFYADLDVSVIDEMPPGRSPVRTHLAADRRRDELVARVAAVCREGGQAYWVCPLVEESEALDLQNAIDTQAALQQALPQIRVGLIHGRMRAEEKSASMEAFARNEIQLLVSTTVIEVGVDVPNASLMVIEHAERFGLAQLHQLRGRVGRGTAESACILLYAQPLSETARARLKVIFENSDGFEIARHDLALRGPGEFIGARQSGLPLLRYADLEDAALLEQARAAAEEMLHSAPAAAERHMQRWLAGAEEMLKA